MSALKKTGNFLLELALLALVAYAIVTILYFGINWLGIQTRPLMPFVLTFGTIGTLILLVMYCVLLAIAPYFAMRSTLGQSLR